jgi:hypothetical protein
MGGAFEGQDPRGCGARQAGRVGLCRFAAHDPARGRAGAGGVPVRAGAGAPAVGDRAGHVAAVRLRGRPAHRRGEDGAVLRMAGLVTVPGGAAHPGQDDAKCVRRVGRDAAPARGRPDVCAHRQREDRHRGARGRDRGAQPADARVRAALLGDRAHLRAGRSGQQGRQRIDGAAGQGRPRADRHEPARRVRLVRRVGDRVRGVLRAGQRPGASGDPPRPGGHAGRGTGPAAPAARSRTRSRSG